MPTVSKATADEVIAGLYPEDGIVRIVEYTNAWGSLAYGLENERDIGRYSPSEYVIRPRVYWERSGAVERRQAIITAGLNNCATEEVRQAYLERCIDAAIEEDFWRDIQRQ